MNSYYKSDKDVVNDAALQAFAAESASPSGGFVKGFPSKIETRKELAKLISHVQYLTTVGHASANYKSTGWLLALPGSTPILARKPPKSLKEVTDDNVTEWIGGPYNAFLAINFQVAFQRPLDGTSEPIFFYWYCFLTQILLYHRIR